jgi:hypothetical protein
MLVHTMHHHHIRQACTTAGLTSPTRLLLRFDAHIEGVKFDQLPATVAGI